MSVTTTTTLSSPAGAALAEASPAATRAGWRHTVGDALAVTWRNLVAYVRLPELIVFSTIQPVIIVLLFRYVFGDSITLSDPSIDYVDYLMPGVFVQATSAPWPPASAWLTTWPSSSSASLAALGPLAVLVGALADTIATWRSWRSSRWSGSPSASHPRRRPACLLAVALVLLFAFALSWVGRPSTPRPQRAAQAAIFPLVFPLTFASTAFVDTSFMPGWLRAFADHQPVSVWRTPPDLRSPAGQLERRGLDRLVARDPGGFVPWPSAATGGSPDRRAHGRRAGPRPAAGDRPGPQSPTARGPGREGGATRRLAPPSLRARRPGKLTVEAEVADAQPAPRARPGAPGHPPPDHGAEGVAMAVRKRPAPAYRGGRPTTAPARRGTRDRRWSTTDSPTSSSPARRCRWVVASCTTSAAAPARPRWPPPRSAPASSPSTSPPPCCGQTGHRWSAASPAAAALPATDCGGVSPPSPSTG